MGYLRNEEKTADTIDDEGWLHSGDIGKFDEVRYSVHHIEASHLIKAYFSVVGESRVFTCHFGHMYMYMYMYICTCTCVYTFLSHILWLL